MKQIYKSVVKTFSTCLTLLSVKTFDIAQIGRLWKFLATNFPSKVAQKFCDFLGSFEKHHFSSKIIFD